jgi:hypothetical protein
MAHAVGAARAVARIEPGPDGAREVRAPCVAIVGTLTGKNPLWAGAAPVLVLTSVRVTLERNESPNAHAWYDTGQAVAMLTIQATSQDLVARQMEGFDRERARTACGVPAPFEPAVVMAIGYLGNPESLVHDVHRAAEVKPRERRPISDFVFDGSWGTPFGPDLD